MLDLRKKIINRKILIYGCGISGITSFQYLKNKNFINIFDDNKKKIPKVFKKYLITKKKLSKIYFDKIIVSPGINIKKCNLTKFLKKNQNKIISDLDIFYINNHSNLKIAITGTNGKSTTSKLLYDVLKKHKKDVRLVGNYGNPILSEKKITKKTIFVIEASSYQIQYSKYFNSEYVAILNLSPDHLERHGTLYNYSSVKFKLIKKQKKGSFAFIEKNNFYLNKLLRKNKIKSNIVKINSKEFNKIKYKIKNPYFDNLNNKNNLKFILEIAKRLKLSLKKIVQVINSFKELKYRQQIIFKSKKLLIINDSKSTSFSSSLNLLQAYKNIFWIIGGLPKKGDVFDLHKKYYKNIHAYIYGKNKIFFIKKLEKKIKFKLFNKLEDVVEALIKDINKEKKFKKNIIFSPAAASFDEFNNFEHRGKYFNYLLKKKNFLNKINERK